MQRGQCRPQNDLEHNYSIQVAGSIVLRKLKSFLPLHFDISLLRDCLLVHDHGEGELVKDTLYHNKNDQQDLNEYEAFCRRYRQLKRSEFRYYEQAFLLQFCLEIPTVFSEKVQRIMAGLSVGKRLEALLFDAIQRWDYVLYAMEQYRQYNNLFLLVGVLLRQKPHLDRLAVQIFGFGVMVWTPPIQKWAQEILDENPKLAEEFMQFCELH